MPSPSLAERIELEERDWKNWGKAITIPAGSDGIVKKFEYRAPTVTLCTLKRSTEEDILAEHQRSSGSSILRDCYLYDRDIYFLSGYLCTQRLEITESSTRVEDLQTWIGDLQAQAPGLSPDEAIETHGFQWLTDRIFAVILQKIEFKLGSGIASIGAKFTQLLPQFNYSQVRGNGEVSRERLEIFLDDW